jgi:hypothetical protein
MVALTAPKWDYVSVSQIESWETCPRVWRYRSVERIREPQSEPQQRGVDIHDVLESYLTGTPYESSPYAGFVENAKQYLPAPGTAHAELKFNLPTYDGGPTFTGFIDLLIPHLHPVHAMDYKTLSDARYMKTPEMLKTNRQLVTYAYVARELGYGNEEEGVEVSHLYCLVTKTKKQNFKVLPPVRVLLHSSDVRRAWYDQLETVKAMQAAVSVPTQELPPNTQSCSKYNRPCFYAKQCGFDGKPNTNLFRIRGAPIMDTTTKGPTFLEKLNAMKANGDAQAPVNVVPAVAAPAPSNVLDAKEVTIQQNGGVILTGKSAALVLGAEVPAGQIFLTSKEVVEQKGFLLPAPAMVPAVPAVGVLPPDAPSRTTPIGAPDPLKTEPAAQEPVAATTPPEAAPKKRGRPKKEGAASEPVATSVDMGSTAVNAATPAEVAPSNAPNGGAGRVITGVGDKVTSDVTFGGEPTARPMPRLGLHLYIDCMPTKQRQDDPEPTLFEDWIAPIAETVAQENGVADYRLVDYTSKPLLAVEIRRRIANVPPVLVISSMAPSAAEAISTLVPYATTITKKC